MKEKEMEVPKVAGLRIGAGKQEIQIPQGYLAIEDFKEVHDPIHVRAIVMEQKEKIAVI